MFEGLKNLVGGAAMMFQHGGVFMWPIAILMLVGTAIALERAYMLFVKLDIDGNGFMANIQKLVASGKLDQAQKVCASHPQAALPQVICAGLVAADEGEVALKNAIDEATLRVLPQIHKRTNYLQMIANVATLLGLLGTIVGIITAFAGIANIDPVARQEALGRGISEALNCTAFGLLLAIPCMIVHSVLSARTLRIVDEMDHSTTLLINTITRNAGAK